MATRYRAKRIHHYLRSCKNFKAELVMSMSETESVIYGALDHLSHHGGTRDGDARPVQCYSGQSRAADLRGRACFGLGDLRRGPRKLGQKTEAESTELSRYGVHARTQSINISIYIYIYIYTYRNI